MGYCVTWIRQLIAGFFLISTFQTSVASAQILAINSLTDEKPGLGSFEGMESRSKKLPDGRKRVTILYLHGIGWTQQNNRLTGDFIAALRGFYGSSFYVPRNHKPGTRCAAGITGNNAKDGGIKITTSRARSFQTDLKNEFLPILFIGCMDRIILNEDAETEFVIYRFFWDNDFWNAIQSPFLGYDDEIYVDAGLLSQTNRLQPKDQRIAGLRNQTSRLVKDSFITYGISDAAMYLGPAGDILRDAVSSAICIAAIDGINDKRSLFNRLESGDNNKGFKVQSTSSACNKNGKADNNLLFVSESMGSRVLFDVLKSTHESGGTDIIETVIKNSPEAYLLGNQIPLIGIGKIEKKSVRKSKSRKPKEAKVQLIAFSDVNDILTYELVPYAEFLWLRTFGNYGLSSSLPRSRSKLIEPDNLKIRDQIANSLGFRITDVRLKYNDSHQPGDELLAAFAVHNYLAFNKSVIQLMLCGSKNGKPNGTFGSCSSGKYSNRK